MTICKYLTVLLLYVLIALGYCKSAVPELAGVTGSTVPGWGNREKLQIARILQIPVADGRRLFVSYEKDRMTYQVDTLQGWLNKRGHFVFDHHSRIEGVPPFLWTSTGTDDRMIPSGDHLKIRYKSETACFLFIMPVMAANAGPPVREFERISPAVKHER